MQRLLLVRHGATSASTAHAFPADESLTSAGKRAAAELAKRLPASDLALTSPARRCRETAEAARLVADVDSRLTECDFGSWAGLTLSEVHALDPAGVTDWMADPDARPHGGESTRALAERVAAWLVDDHPGTTVVITHGGVIRAAAVHVLDAPVEAIWRIEAEPLSVTELVRHGSAWQLVRLNSPRLK
jgi:broad specificity phosphatase PhoE